MKINRNQWKYLAVLAMLLDHIAFFLVPDTSALYYVFRTIGRLTAPTMAFFLAEGYQYTRSKEKYALRLLLFALISQPVFSYALHRRLDFTEWNIGLTLLLSFLAVWFYDNGPIPANRTLMIGALVLFSCFGDWGVIVPVLTLVFYSARADREKQARIYAVLAAAVVLIGVFYESVYSGIWYREIWQMGMFLFLPFLFWYNGEKGSGKAIHKWFFYLFYPVHLALLLLMAGI